MKWRPQFEPKDEPTLPTPGTVTPNTNNSANSDFNVLHIASSFSYADLTALRSASSPPLGSNRIRPSVHAGNKSLFMDWHFGFNYLNNFNYTAQKMTCDGTADFNKLFATAAVDGLTSTATMLEVEHYNVTLFDETRLPFKLLVSSAAGQERVIVTSLVMNDTHFLLHIQRSTPAVDFANASFAMADIAGANISDANSSATPVFPANPPAAWLCSAKLYNARDGCHCECGVFDPDCTCETQDSSKSFASWQHRAVLTILHFFAFAFIFVLLDDRLFPDTKGARL